MTNGTGRTGPCHWCKRTMLHPRRVDCTRNGSIVRRGLVSSEDHVTPQCLGGNETVWACTACNNVKGNLTPEQWITVMDAVPNWWKRFHQRLPTGFALLAEIQSKNAAEREENATI